MVEQDAVDREEAVAFPVVARHPVGIELGRGIGAPGTHGGRFILGRRGGAKQFAGRGLVKPGLDAAAADGLQEPGDPQAGHIPGIFGHVEADPHMALGGQVIDFVRLDIVDQMAELPGVAQIPIMQKKPGPCFMGVHVQVVNAPGIEGAGPAHQAMHFITLGQEELGQIAAVLSGNPGNQRLFTPTHQETPFNPSLLFSLPARRIQPQ